MEHFHLVGNVPDELDASDGIAQTCVQAVINQELASAPTLLENFQIALCMDVPLLVLKREYEKDMKDMALQHLSKCSKVTIDADFLHTQDQEDLLLDTSTHYLDFFMVVLSIKGLHAITPRNITNPSYMFCLDLNQRHRLW